MDGSDEITVPDPPVDDEEESMELLDVTQDSSGKTGSKVLLEFKPQVIGGVVGAVVLLIVLIVVITSGGGKKQQASSSEDRMNAEMVEAKEFQVTVEMEDAVDTFEVEAEVRLDGDFSTVQNDIQGFTESATVSIADSLQVDASQVEIVDIFEGSIVIDFTVTNLVNAQASAQIVQSVSAIEVLNVDDTALGVLESSADVSVYTAEDAVADSLAENLGIESEDVQVDCEVDGSSCTYTVTDTAVDTEIVSFEDAANAIDVDGVTSVNVEVVIVYIPVDYTTTDDDDDYEGEEIEVGEVSISIDMDALIGDIFGEDCYAVYQEYYMKAASLDIVNADCEDFADYLTIWTQMDACYNLNDDIDIDLLCNGNTEIDDDVALLVISECTGSPAFDSICT